MNNRINLTVDAYWRKNNDLIGYANSKLYGSYNLANVASMKSNGIEFSLSTTNIQNKDFSWQTSFIYSYSHNEITDLYSQARIIDLVQGEGYSLKGYPVNSVFSIPFAGLNNEGLPTFYDENGNLFLDTISSHVMRMYLISLFMKVLLSQHQQVHSVTPSITRTGI